MGDVQSNAVNVLFSRETALGTASTLWQQMEPNDLPKFGAEVRKVARNPMSKNRQRRKGDAVGVESMPSIDMDLTWEHLYELLEAVMFAGFTSPSPTTQSHFVPTAVTATGYTVAANGALPNGHLVYARGFVNAANNGLKKLAGASIGTEIKTPGLVVEGAIPATQNVQVDVAGVEGAAADITVNASGDLQTTALNWTTLGLFVGQWIWVGGDLAAESFALTQNRGLARIKSISATILGLERKSQAFATDNGAGKTIRIFFGQWCRNVAVDHASYVKRSYTIEVTYAELATPGPGDEYEYAVGTYLDEITFNFELEALTTMSVGMVGTDTAVPVESAGRKTGASAPKRVVSDSAFNTTSDFIKLMLAETTETLVSIDFTSLSLTIRNNVSPRKVLGSFAARKINIGAFEIDIDATVIFNESRVISAIRNNDTMTMWFGQRSENGAYLVDVPSLIIEGGGRDYPRNEQVLIQWPGVAVQDPTLGYSVSVSTWPYIPVS